MSPRRIPTTPIAGQKAGTSGLRRRTVDFMVPGFVENYVQAIFDAIGGAKGKTFVLGGDGRYFNAAAAQTILQMAAGNGAARVIIGQGALLSTPAVSHLIRQNSADGGFILSASHNPGGPDGDFGIKYNMANGGSASPTLTDRIYDCTQTIDHFWICETADIPLNQTGTVQIGDMKVDIIDPVTAYADLMETLFDFPAMRAAISDGLTLTFDAMHAVTGPYATEIFERRLGLPKASVRNATPLPDFGGGHPDPNPVWAKDLMGIMHGRGAPDLGAASDGDGDRNMIVGKGSFVSPSDSLAVIAANAYLVPGYRSGLRGVARSMPTSAAVDRVAAAKNLPCYVTPTGWKFFGSLLDAGLISLCGEESAGTGADHLREKDGLWAVLMWLNILVVRQQSVTQIMTDHWETYGRNYYARHDYEGVPPEKADAVMRALTAMLDTMVSQSYAGLTVAEAAPFDYTDPVDGSTAEGQGIQICFSGGARIVLRLSGTGTVGATLRLYLEMREDRGDRLHLSTEDALAQVTAAAQEMTQVAQITGRGAPDVIT